MTRSDNLPRCERRLPVKCVAVMFSIRSLVRFQSSVGKVPPKLSSVVKDGSREIAISVKLVNITIRDGMVLLKVVGK